MDVREDTLNIDAERLHETLGADSRTIMGVAGQARDPLQSVVADQIRQRLGFLVKPEHTHGLLMAVGVGAFEFLWPQAQTWSGHLIALALAAGIGVGLYVAFAIGLKLPELRWLLTRAVRNGN